MAEFVNQQVMQQRAASKDAAIQQALQMAQIGVQRQQAQQAQQQRAFQTGLTVLDQDWVPVEDKVKIANSLGQMFGIKGEITVDGLQPYRTLLQGMEKDFNENKDLSRWSSAVDLFQSNPKFVDPTKRAMVFEAGQRLQEQRAQQVATAQVPSVPGGLEAVTRTQEARQRLATFSAIQPDDPEAGRKTEEWTRLYGSTERLNKQLAADALLVRDEDARLKEREQLIRLYRMNPADAQKQASHLTDPKTMLLPVLSRAIQEKGIDNLSEKDLHLFEAHAVLNGDDKMLEVFGVRSASNQLKQYQQDLAETQVQLGTLNRVSTALDRGATLIRDYETKTLDALKQVKPSGTHTETAYQSRQDILAQLQQDTEAMKTAWAQSTQPLKDELIKGAATARQAMEEVDRTMRQPGVDRLMLAKRKDFYEQLATSNERMADAMGVDSELNVALKRAEVATLQAEASGGPTPEARKTAANLLKAREQELKSLEQAAEQHRTSLTDEKARLERYLKLSQARITVGDKKFAQEQRDAAASNAFLGEWIQSGFKLAPETWHNANQSYFSSDPDGFMKVVKPALENRHNLMVAQGQRELQASGDYKQAGAIAGKYPGVRVDELLPALKDPNRPMAEISLFDPKQNVQEASKLANIQQSIREIGQIRELLVSPTGEINRGRLFAAAFDIPFTTGRDINTFTRKAVEIKLRAATGAAARPDETRNYMNIFAPSVKDSDELIRYKIDAFEEWLQTVASTTDPTGDLRKRAENLMAPGITDVLKSADYQALRERNPQASVRDIVNFLQSRKK